MVPRLLARAVPTVAPLTSRATTDCDSHRDKLKRWLQRRATENWKAGPIFGKVTCRLSSVDRELHELSAPVAPSRKASGDNPKLPRARCLARPASNNRR